MTKLVGPATDALEGRMRTVLLRFALTSNGSTASWDPGGGDGDNVPTLGYGDAPEYFWKARWDAAETDDARKQVVVQAEKALKALQHTQADHAAYESRADRDRRIVEHGEGIAAREVAIWARCGVRDVWAARAGAGRDTEYGRLLPVLAANGGAGRPRVDVAHQVAELTAGGMSARQVADELDVSYNTVRRALGRNA